jgi:hypothetical protein
MHLMASGGPAIVLHDYAPAHTHPNVVRHTWIHHKNLHFVMVPRHSTGFIQPMDVGVNKQFGQYYSQAYDEHMARVVREAAQRGEQFKGMSAQEWRNLVVSLVCEVSNAFMSLSE